MCTVWTLTSFGYRAVDPAALEPKARMEQIWKQWMEPYKRQSMQKKSPQKPVAKVRLASAPAPLQCGGNLVKSTSYDGKDDYGDHYRMRCNAANDRNKTCGLRKRRLQVQCW